MLLRSSEGVLSYGENYKLVVLVDQSISNYYRALLPKYVKTQPQKYPAHISVVRKETPAILDNWGKYDGELVEFFYTHEVFFGKVYCWVNVFCKRLEDIRLELGLPVSSPYTLPPEGFSKCFHMTIGNFKNDSRNQP